MAKRKRFQQPFDKRGGVLIISTYLIKQKQYLSLMPQAKVLMLLLHEHWRPDKLVDYGVREAAAKISCDPKTARKAFDQLQERGFITCMELAFFSSRTQSKSRTWRLDWMPFNDRPPANTWEKWTDD